MVLCIFGFREPHGVAAHTADDFLAKGISFRHDRNTFLVLPHPAVGLLKEFFGDDALMGVIHHNPIVLAVLDGMPASDAIPFPLAVDAFSNVAFITKNFADVSICPVVLLVDAGPAVPGTTRSPLIQHGGRGAGTVELCRNHGGLYALRCQAEYHPYHIRRFLIHEEAVFILRGLHISIGSKGAEEQPLFRPHPLGVLDLGRQLTAV